MNIAIVGYKRDCLPPQIIAHAVYLYYRLLPILRLIEEILLESGTAASYEIRPPALRSPLAPQQHSQNDVWHLAEVVITMQERWLWQSVDQDAYVLDEIVQNCPDTKRPSTCWPTAEEAMLCAETHDH